MSAALDAFRILDEEISAFAFLPAVNYMVVFLQRSEPHWKLSLFSLFAVFISVSSYNMLSNINFSSYTGVSGSNSHQESLLTGLDLILPIVTGVLWLIVFGASILSLHELFPSTSILPEISVAISFLFIFLVTTDILFNSILSTYNEGGPGNSK